MVVKGDEYDKYLTNYNSPDIEFLELKAKDRGLVVVDEAEYKRPLPQAKRLLKKKQKEAIYS